MDFWASLEHKIRYKFESEIPSGINDDLLECANIVSSLDAKMLSLNKDIEKAAKH
jgi:putative GTP pyrophosphokinase